MIHPVDAFVLAYTKLRTNKIRTSLTVGISGILFGLMLAVVFVVQGVFDSADRFNAEGLSGRSIILVSNVHHDNFSAYNYLEDASFIREVEELHSTLVAKKTAAAEKYNVAYNALFEDPSPITIDPTTKRKTIAEEYMTSQSVIAAVKARKDLDTQKASPFDIKEYLKTYKTATVLPDYYQVSPSAGTFTYMKDGKEDALLEDKPLNRGEGTSYISELSGFPPVVINEAVTAPFVTNKQFDASKGEIPAIIPFSQAARILGLQPLDKKATTQQRLERLEEVRRRIGEVSVGYCYRNEASNQLLSEAIEQQREMKRGEKITGYKEPALVYTVPSDESCGAVKVASDTRTADEKLQAENEVAYQKEIGVYLGEPEQRKVVFRGVGITGDAYMGDSVGVADMAIGLLGSHLGYGSLAVPVDLLRNIPEKDLPKELFSAERSGRLINTMPQTGWEEETYLVEFSDKEEARTFLRQNSGQSQGPGVMQFGSNSLIIDEIKQGFMKVILWSLTVIGGIALIILSSMIGRTVSEGRRESAVFRAIGAKRIDIAEIYGCYAFLLAVRVVVFALVLGLVLALAVEFLGAEQATVGARFAYAASDTSLEFHLFSVMSWYVPLIIGSIVIIGVFASAIPIIRSARRNPIQDMRDDT